MKERMSLLNRMLLPLAPRLAYRREAWRLLARSAYTAEDASPRSAGWERTNRTGEATNQAGRDVIRARARDLERNSDVMEAILGAMERNVVGTGFVLQAKTEDESLNERIEASWRSWCSLRSCEITERWTLNELIALCVRRRMIDGGVLLLLAVQDGRLRLQLLEVDELDTSVTVCGKNRVYGGVEVNEYRRPAAYHIKVYDVWGAWLRTERYPAEGVIYLPYLTRPSQVREISPAAATLPRVDDLNELIDAAIEKERVLAHLSVAVEKEQGTLTGSPFYGRGLPGAESGEPKPEPVATELLQQGSITYLKPGEKVSTISQAGTSSVVSDTLRTTQRLAGSGLGLSYEAVARDMSQVNYSSARQGLLEDQRTYRMQQQYIIDHLLDVIYPLWLDLEVLSGRLTLPGYFDAPDRYRAHVWVTAGWEWIDPQKEANANKIALETNQTTLQSICAGKGRDWREVLQQRAREEQLAQELGLTRAESAQTIYYEDGEGNESKS